MFGTRLLNRKETTVIGIISFRFFCCLYNAPMHEVTPSGEAVWLTVK